MHLVQVQKCLFLFCMEVIASGACLSLLCSRCLTQQAGIYRRLQRSWHTALRCLCASASLDSPKLSVLPTPRRYAQVLRANPACPAEVRLGIAACYYRAGKLDAATAAYNRVLQLDGNNADALLGLAVIKFGSSNAQEVRICCCAGQIIQFSLQLCSCFLYVLLVPVTLRG
jgi:tetratricopeptide (TPR) repeat protein